jgi:hypothetical protein
MGVFSSIFAVVAAAVLPTLFGLFVQYGPRNMPTPAEVELFPQPDWMSKTTVNYGVMGQTGAGKSGLINGMRKIKRGEQGFAAEDVIECTDVPTPYEFGSHKVLLYDMPGVGTLSHPRETYGRDIGLRWLFGGIICIKDGRPGQDDAYLVQFLEHYNTPYYVVNNRCKNLIRGDLESWMSEDDAIEAL